MQVLCLVAQLRLTENGATSLLEMFLSFQTLLYQRMTAKMLKLVPGMDRDDMRGSLPLSCRVTNLLARFHTAAAWPFGSCNPISSRELHPLQLTINPLPATLPQGALSPSSSSTRLPQHEPTTSATAD